MSSGPRDLRRHLTVLRERMAHPTAYEKALDYFAKELADDRGFHEQSVPASTAAFANVLAHMIANVVGKQVPLANLVVLELRGFGFYHGAFTAGTRVAMFFYFQDACMGVMQFAPGLKGSPSHVARFRFWVQPNAAEKETPS